MFIKNIKNSFNLEAQIITASQIEITKQLECGLIEFTYKGCPFIFNSSEIYSEEAQRLGICVLEEIHPKDEKEYFANYDKEAIGYEYDSLTYKNEISESSAKDLVAAFSEYWDFNDEAPAHTDNEIKIFAYWDDEKQEVEFSLVRPYDDAQFYKEMTFKFGSDAHYLFYSLCRIGLKFDFDGQNLVGNIKGNGYNPFLSDNEVTITKNQINITTGNKGCNYYTDFDFSFTAFVMQDKATFKFGNIQFDLDMLPF